MNGFFSFRPDAHRFVAVAVCVLLLGPAPLLRAADPKPLLTYTGDGLTIIVAEWSDETGTVRGTIRRGGDAWPFTGRFAEENGAEIVRGTFTAGNTQHAFTSTQAAGSEEIVFTTGTKSYRLRPPAAGDKPVENVPPGPKNPLEETGPRADNPPIRKSDDAKPGELPTSMRLKLHTFSDVTLGGMPAYAVMMPEGWTSQGKIEWSQGELAHPQMQVEIKSPGDGRLRYIPAITLSYLVSKPIAGMPNMPPQGIPAPDDFPRWLMQAVEQTNKAVSNVRLIDSRRDAQAEQQLTEIQRQTNTNDAGMLRECHIITFEYDEAGTRRREEVSMLYVRLAPIDNMNIFSQQWMVFTTYQISAPTDQFDALRPKLLEVAGRVQQTPEWWWESQRVLAELSRKRMEGRWTAIQNRGREIAKLNDEQYAKYKAEINKSKDPQRERIKTIYETDDFRDTDGNIVNLPMHYHHVFSDGKGNYVLSNNSHDKPGETWTEIERMK